VHPDNLNTFFQQFSTMMAPLCFSDCRYIAQTGRGTVGDPSDSAGPVMSETDLVRQPNRSIRTLQLRDACVLYRQCARTSARLIFYKTQHFCDWLSPQEAAAQPPRQRPVCRHATRFRRPVR